MKVVELEGLVQIDSDVKEGLWFEGRNWQDLTVEDWRHHNCGWLYFTPEAFAYYLQSLLVLVIDDPKHYPDLALDSVLWSLDRTPEMSNLDPSILDRYSTFTRTEFEVVKEWLLFACEAIPSVFWGAAASGPGDGFGRAFETLSLIEGEISGRGDAGK